jgi:DNA-binding transcriptional regulator YiaG
VSGQGIDEPKHPRGASLKLLTLVAKKGLQAVA